MELSKEALKQMKAKMKSPPPAKSAKGKSEADPMFDIPTDAPDAGDGDVDNKSRNDSADAGASAREVGRAADGDIGSSGEGDEGTPDHEETEGKHEKAAEDDKLADMSDEDLLHELKRRGHPAGEHLDKSKGVDEEASDYKEESDEAAEES